jgi:thioredoxin-like negative regulator of GroEL
LYLLLFFLASFSPAFCADANSEWSRAQQLFQGGDFNRALPALLALDKSFPSNVKLHYMIGMCYKHLEKTAQAQRELTWVSSYAQDASLKQSASAALSELKTAQWHIGDIIEASGSSYRDAGPCMTCMGTGWVKK